MVKLLYVKVTTHFHVVLRVFTSSYAFTVYTDRCALFLLYPIMNYVMIHSTLVFQEPITLPKGAILHLKGTNEDTTREIIRETLERDGLDVVYVQFCTGCSEACVRLQGENSSKEVHDLSNHTANCIIPMALFMIYYA